MLDFKIIIIIAAIAYVMYAFVLPPATKEKVGTTMSAAKEIGSNIAQAGQYLAGSEKGKVNCTTDTQCQAQYGNNTTCNTVSGTCFQTGA